MARNVSAVLIVESGVHQSARAVLANDRSHVGSSAANDIVISDLQVSGTALTLEHRGQDIVLHADAPVEFAAGKSLAPGKSTRCVSDVSFASGGVSMRLEITGYCPETPFRWVPLWPEARLLIAAAVVVAAIVLLIAVSFRAAPVDVQSEDAKEMTGSISTAMSRKAASSSDQGQVAAIESLRQHLTAVDLGSLAVTAQPDGSIVAQGQISKVQRATWQEAQRWFDNLARGQVTLVNAVGVAAEAKPLSIEAVWPGSIPYLIDGNGDKHFIGSTLSSGWTVAEIDRTHVLIKRGDQSLSVRF